MKRKVISMLLVVAMAASMLTGCGSEGSGSESGGTQESGTTNEETGDTGTDSEEAGDSGEAQGDNASGESYSIAGSTWGAGAYPLDIIVHAEEIIANLAGIQLDVADNQFTADKVVTDLESQLATSPDGVVLFTVVDAVFGTLKEKLDGANVPYVVDTNFPSDEGLWEEFKEDPLFIGAATASQYEIGVEIAETMLADGHKTATILAAASGDYSHDTRIAGFTAKFEEGGGTILQVMHCSDPSEATTKANDLLTANPDMDAVYATGGDYLSALAAIKSADSSAEYAIYGTDIAPDLIDSVTDGTIAAMNGGQHLCGALSLCMLINYLDGHPIQDSDGKSPIIDDFPTFLITKDNAAGFKVLYAEESCFITDEEFQVLLYRYNPEVTYADFEEFVKGYTDNIYAKAAAAE